jgi:biopolymer transport protein ExbD
MRIPSHSGRRSALDTETMTPMIDVVFLLLVFFVCASIGQTPDKLLPATLNAGSSTLVNPADPAPEREEWDHQQVRIHLRHSGVPGRPPVVELNEQPLTGIPDLEQRLKRLAAVDPLSPIILDIDDQVKVQQFISIYDLCQSLSFRKISFAARTGR